MWDEFCGVGSKKLKVKTQKLGCCSTFGFSLITFDLIKIPSFEGILIYSNLSISYFLPSTVSAAPKGLFFANSIRIGAPTNIEE